MKDRVWLFLQELGFIYTNIFTAYVFTAIASGVLAFIAFILLNIPYPFVLAGDCCDLHTYPLVGAIWVFIPLALLYLLQGDYMLSVILVVCGLLIFVVPQYVHFAAAGSEKRPDTSSNNSAGLPWAALCTWSAWRDLLAQCSMASF